MRWKSASSLSLGLGLGSFSFGQATSIPRQESLLDCLAAVGVPVSSPNSRAYDQDVAPFNERLPYTPIAIAVPTTIGQIQGAVSCGSQQGLKVSPKCGGHSYASLGLGGEDGHLVLELDRMSQVTLHPDNTATIQGGARLGHVATELWSQGGRAIAHGTCPGVGISGHALHGGFGMSSFTHGLALDWITSMTIVLANGTVTKASERENPDLFWALRGAGSSFGVVVEMEVNTFAPVDNYSHFEVQLNWETQDDIVSGWMQLQDWGAREMPREMNLRFGVDGRGVHLDGLYAGTWDEMLDVLQPLVDRLGGGNFTVKGEYDWIGQLQAYGNGPDLDQTHPYNLHETFYATSLATKALPRSALEAFVSYALTVGASLSPKPNSDGGFSGNRFWWILIDIHGGANSYIETVPEWSTSYAHRDKLLLFQFYDRVFDTSYPSDGFSFLQDWMRTITDHMEESDWGMYVNYADPQLSQEQAMEYYWRQNLGRLRSIKKQVDPGELFYNPLGVRPAA